MICQMGFGVDSSGSGQGTVDVSCEDSSETLDSMKPGTLLTS
jgi:hypothetical protein